MIVVYARLLFAFVVKDKSLWNGTDILFIHVTMNKYMLSIQTGSSISMCIFTSEPKPTTVRFFVDCVFYRRTFWPSHLQCP